VSTGFKKFQPGLYPVDPQDDLSSTPPAPIAPVAGLSYRGMPTGTKMTTPAPHAQTDWGGVASAGIGAAGQTMGTIAQLAGQKAALDSALAQSQAGRMLSEKLAKMELAQQQGQFDTSQKLRGLMWALGANKAAIGTSGAGRDIRRQDQQMLSDVLARLYLR
jgi:hypothetical protein